jgi:hypothetical protein
MKDKRSMHVKIQEMADCYATTDPLEEMAGITKEKDLEEAAVKWLALAAIHGINANAEKISMTQTVSGEIEVKAKYREAELPSPGSLVGNKILEAVREVSHLEGEEGSTVLAVGIRDSSFEMRVNVGKEDGERVILEFPDIFSAK